MIRAGTAPEFSGSGIEIMNQIRLGLPKFVSRLIGLLDKCKVKSN